jgi:Na+-transporting NADH:ubiquinone oxidoreductase subunit NqrC
MSPKCKLLLVFALLVLNISSCSRSKAYFANQGHRENREIKHQELILLASDSKNPFILQVDLNAPMKLEATHDASEVGENVTSAHFNTTTKRDLNNQKKVFQKEVVSTIKKFKAQNKIAEKKSGSTHWEPRLKIGVTLLVIGIVLSVFGLGLIGGISAFIGLLFTILGLLNTYY